MCATISDEEEGRGWARWRSVNEKSKIEFKKKVTEKEEAKVPNLVSRRSRSR